MTVFTDNIIFLVSGVQRLSHSGDTISISRNLTIASPSTFVSAVPLTFSTSNTSASLIQTIQPSDLATNVLAVRAQDAYAGAVTNVLGGNLTLSSGLGTTAGNSGSILIQTGGTTRLSVSPTNVTIPGIVSAAYLKTDGSGNITAGTSLAITNIAPGTSGQVLMSNATPATTWTTFSGDVTVGATGTTTVNSISGSSPISITPSNLQWLKTTTAPTILQAAQTTDTATINLTIQAQNAFASASTNKLGGNLVLTGGTSVAGQATGQVVLQAAGSDVVRIGNNTNSTNGFSLSFPNNSTLNFAGSGSTVGTSNASCCVRAAGLLSIGGTSTVITDSGGANTYLTVTPSTGTTSVAFSNLPTTSITINQAALASGASAGTTTTGVPMSLTAQAGQANSTNSGTGGTGGALTISAGTGGAETGTTSTGGAGGNLVLTSGAGGTGTTAGAAGNVNIQAGGTNIAVATPNQFQMKKGVNVNVTAKTANYTILATDYIIAVGTLSSAITITLPSAPSTGDMYQVKDASGSAFTFNITVSGSQNIDGSSTYVIATNYACLTLVYTGSQWSVM